MHKPSPGTRLERALARWQSWPLTLTEPPKIKASALTGQTNHNVRVEAPGIGHDLVLRLHHPASSQLGIDRAQEKMAIQAAFEIGITRPALHWDDQLDYSIFPYLEARAWTAGDFAKPDQRRRLWTVLDQMAQIKLPLPRRSYTNYLQRYWNVLDSRNAVDADLAYRWKDFQMELSEFDAAEWSACLVHHDLTPANVLDTGQRLILVDWEYAAMGHPDIDRWSFDPNVLDDPFIGRLFDWINRLWQEIVKSS